MFGFLLNGITNENVDGVSADISRIGAKLVSAQGVFMALVFVDNAELAAKLLQPTLDLYKLTTIKANVA